MYQVSPVTSVKDEIKLLKNIGIGHNVAVSISEDCKSNIFNEPVHVHSIYIYSSAGELCRYQGGIFAPVKVAYIEQFKYAI